MKETTMMYRLAEDTNYVDVRLASSTLDCLCQRLLGVWDQLQGSVLRSHIAQVGVDGLCK